MNYSNRKILIIGCGIRNSISDYLFNSVERGVYDRAEYIYIFDRKKRIIRFLHTALHSRFFSRYKLYNLIDWSRYYSLTSNTNYEDAIIVFNLASLFHWYISPDYIKKIRSYFPRAELVWLLIDHIDKKSEYYDTFLELRKKFDRCITFDPQDAEEYAMEYRMLPYEKNNELVSMNEFNDIKIANDVYYIGREKNRGMILEDISNYFATNNIRARIIEVSNNIEKGRIRRIRKSISYEHVIKDVINSNCILELINSGKGTSLRYYEAIVYKKKLLTNNYEVRKLPYFDERYIRVFTNIFDIDCDWVKKVENVDYSYDGAFDMQLFLDYLRD